MVYCGKPSRGCQMCRTRRIKCDETKPTCNQCAKSRRQCPGYKDEFDLIFRNETKATERRAQKANRKAMAQNPGEDHGDSASSSERSLSPASKEAATTRALQVFVPPPGASVEQMASCHFLANFVLLPRQGGTRGFMEYLIPLIKSRPKDDHLAAAFNACAMGSLGNRVTANGVDLGARALSEYTRALAATHRAVQDPKQAKTDATLATVLLLGLFENLTARQRGSFAWGSHIEGAIQLVRSRGREQLQTKTGLLLFIAVRTQMVVRTLATAKSPVMGVDWWLSDAVSNSAAAESQRLNLRAAELSAEVARLLAAPIARTSGNVRLMFDMIRGAQGIDQDCVSWEKNLPEAWHYKTVAWEDNVPEGDYGKAEVFPGRVDIYGDFYIASVVNMVRACRLFLSSVIVRCAAWVCSPVDYRTTPEYATAARACVDVITDVLASVPYHLGWHLRRRHLLRDQLAGFACGEEDALKGLAGYFLSWPLGCVFTQDYTTDSQRAWILGRFKYIADECGIKYAHILSQNHLRLPSMLIRQDARPAQQYHQVASGSGTWPPAAAAARQAPARPSSSAGAPLPPLAATQEGQQPGRRPDAGETSRVGGSDPPKRLAV